MEDGHGGAAADADVEEAGEDEVVAEELAIATDEPMLDMPVEDEIGLDTIGDDGLSLGIIDEKAADALHEVAPLGMLEATPTEVGASPPTTDDDGDGDTSTKFSAVLLTCVVAFVELEDEGVALGGTVQTLVVLEGTGVSVP